MSWILNTIIISALIILIFHYLYEHFDSGVKTPDLADLKTQQYKAIIEKLTREKETEAKNNEDMDAELTKYMQSKIEA